MKSKNTFLEQASWLWPGVFYEDNRNIYADFRYDFQLKRKNGKATLTITADQCYMLYFNGEYIGRGPARGYQASWPYDEYDLSKYVRKGHNWLSVRVYNAGCSTFQYLHQSAYGMICAGEICGRKILSGEGWTGRISAANRRDTVKLSVQLNYQEWMDARIDDQGWIISSRCPSGWKSPAVKRPFGCMPWHSLEPRGIPNLSNEILGYRVLWRGAGGCDAQYQTASNLTLPWFRELERLKWERTDESCETGQVFAESCEAQNAIFSCKSHGFLAKQCDSMIVPAAGKDGLKAFVFDMGRPTVGTLIVEAEDAKGGEILDFFFCEVVSGDGRPILYDPEEFAVVMSSRLILRKGRTKHEFYQMMGHRYMTVIARGTTVPLKIKVGLRETIYPLEIKGDFKSGNDGLNGIYKICMQTQRVCSLDSYVDTPWREQAQWWGDVRVQAQNTFHLSGDTRLLVRGIRSIARQEVPNGLTYGHAPTMAHSCILPDFSLIWLLTIWDYYFQTGDLELFKEQYERIRRVLSYFRGEGRSKNGLLRFDRRYWLFLDWSDLYREGNPALLNLWYVLTLEKLAKMAGLADMRREQNELTDEYRGHCRKVIAAFWDEKMEMFCDGLTDRGKRVDKHSIHTQTLAILCGLQSAQQRTMFERLLLPYARDDEIPGAKPSSYWVTYVYEVLKRSGYGAEVVRHIHQKWTPMTKYGGTRETFHRQLGLDSVTHAWAAHPLCHLAGILGGVLQNEPAWKKIIFRPVIMPEYKFTETTVPTPHGKIHSAWKIKDDEVEVKLDLPHGVKADVILPGVKEQISGKKKWVVTFE